MKLRPLRWIALAFAGGMIASAGLTTVKAEIPEALQPVISKASEYAKDLAEYTEKSEAGDKSAVEPSWSDYVSTDPSELWASIQEAAGDEETGDAFKTSLDELPAEVQAAIYANVWTPSSGFTGFIVNNLWILLSAALVFIMHLGFSTLESGLCQAKNTVNVLFKNSWILIVGILTYYFWGFNAHYPGFAGDSSTWEGLQGYAGLGSLAAPGGLLTGGTNLYNEAYVYWTDFIFQGMFAATAATIVSGAVAERVKLVPFMIFAMLLVMFAYPVAGCWKWGGGFLEAKGFVDFAGSTMVHGFGGFAALACVLVLGPRKGKYTKNGIKPILGHSMPLAVIGVFLLFLGWFGFNGGSVLSAEPESVARVFVTTTLGAVGGGAFSIFTAWFLLKKPDLSMALNGVLGGLVGITASADILSPNQALVVGSIAGVLVVFAIMFFDKVKVDDPVGAISVHGVCGVYGTIMCGLGDGVNWGVQILGAAIVCSFGFLFSFAVFSIMKRVVGVRVPEDMELEGLDVAEHGSPAYSELVSTQ